MAFAAQLAALTDELVEAVASSVQQVPFPTSSAFDSFG